MKAFKLLVVIGFALMLLLAIGCGQKEEPQTETATDAATEAVDTMDTLGGEMAPDSMEVPETVEEEAGH